MQVLRVRNVHQALPAALGLLGDKGVKRDSRFGPVVMYPEPVTTVYERPLERVMFWPWRDANPFFHLFEALWMLGGRRDVAYVKQFAANMAQFSDDKETFHGAYGYRWRKHFGREGYIDQLRVVAEALKKNPDCRRQILQMWDPDVDLGGTGVDLPCNVSASVQIGVDGRLNLTVFCRSNDIIWGAYGANAVHMSIMQEYLAAMAGYLVGMYTQISVNWHAYTNILDKLPGVYEPYDPYINGRVTPYPLIHSGESLVWDEDLYRFLNDGIHAELDCLFLRDVALPMLRAHAAWKSTTRKDDAYKFAIMQLIACEATDWRLACTEWFKRRYDKWVEEQK